MTYTAEEIEKLLAAGALKRIGMGSRRACYRLPDGRHCLKCYRSEEEIAEGKYPGLNPPKPLAPGAAREIRRYRFDERHNSCCQEYRYWLELKRRLPSDLMDVFPGTIEMVRLPTRGWALIEELVLNADGTPLRRFAEEWWTTEDAKRRVMLLDSYASLGEMLARHLVRFYDIANILVQHCLGGAFRLRIADFEPTSRLLVPVDRIPVVARYKIRRRFARHLSNWSIATQGGAT